MHVFVSFFLFFLGGKWGWSWPFGNDFLRRRRVKHDANRTRAVSALRQRGKMQIQNAQGKGREGSDLEFANYSAYTRIACCTNKGLDSCQIIAASLRWRQVWLADWLMWALHEMCVCVCVCVCVWSRWDTNIGLVKFGHGRKNKKGVLLRHVGSATF